MRKYLVLIILALLFNACSNEKKDLYNQAVEKVKETLKSPSSAKFDDYKEDLVAIRDSIGTGNPFEDLPPELTKHEFDNTPYSFAGVEINYEAQNSFGVFMRGKQVVVFIKWHAKNFPDEWKFHKMLDS